MWNYLIFLLSQYFSIKYWYTSYFYLVPPQSTYNVAPANVLQLQHAVPKPCTRKQALHPCISPCFGYVFEVSDGDAPIKFAMKIKGNNLKCWLKKIQKNLPFQLTIMFPPSLNQTYRPSAGNAWPTWHRNLANMFNVLSFSEAETAGAPTSSKVSKAVPICQSWSQIRMVRQLWKDWMRFARV